MRRTTVVAMCTVLLTGLVAGPVQGAPKKKKPKKMERTVEFEYECPCLGLYQLGGATGGDPNLGGGVITVGAGEVFFAAEAKDASGQSVFVSINQDTDGDGFNNEVANFCGKTDAPLPINEGLEVRVFVGDPSPNCPGPAAGGTITFIFSNMP